MDDLCTACLCSGRNLCLITDTRFYQFYTEMLDEIPVFGTSSICIKVCWECRALLKKFQSFKKQVQRYYSELLDHVHHNIPPRPLLTKSPRLQICQIDNVNYPEIKIEMEDTDGTDLKSEIGDVKTFVEEVPVVLEKENTEKVKKTRKKVGRKRQDAKVKKKQKKDSPKKRKRKNKDSPKKRQKIDIIECESKQNIIEESNIDDVDIGNDDDIGNDVDFHEDVSGNETEDTKTIEEIKLEAAEGVQKKEVPKGPKAKLDKANGEAAKVKPQCVECNKTFASRKTYRFHMNVIHKGQNHYPCKRCGRVYQWKSNLDRHMRSHRARDKGDDFYCAPCDIHFASVCTYKQHFKVSKQHAPDRQRHGNYECNECGKKFLTKTQLGDHIDWEHLKKIKFRCEICNNKPFKTQASLKLHEQNKHSNLKGKKGHLCHVCGKSYQFACQLKEHVTGAHTTDTPHRCPLCAAAFGYSTSLYGHIREVHYKIKTKRKRPKKPKKTKDMEPTLQQLVFPTLQPGPP